MYKVEDCGIFIGELNSPYDNGKEFFEKQVKELFSNYKKDLAVNGVTLPLNTPFYSPSAYCLLGNYDLAVLSLIDDFHFGSKYFHPYGSLNNPNGGDEYLDKKGFNYHITVGSCTSISGNYLISKAKETFLRSQDRYPFIGISNIKVKNSLLIGSGYEVVHLALSALKNTLSEFQCKNPSFDFIIFEPISWSEISVVFFSDDLKKVSDALLVIREMDIQYALDHCELDFKSYTNRIKGDILNRSLMHDLLKDQLTEQTMLSSHLFTHTYSNLGVDLNWLWNYSPNKFKTEITVPGFLTATYDSTFEAFTRWFVKPSYLEKFLNTHNVNKDFNLIVGNGDIEAKQPVGLDGFTDLLGDLRKFLGKREPTPDEYSNSIRKTKTIPRFLYQKDTVRDLLTRYDLGRKISESANDTYESVSNKLTEFVFGTSIISRIRADLIKLKVSKSLRERIINAYINFNDGIQDPILYTNFSELYHYLIFIKELIATDAQSDDGEDSEVRHSKYNAFIEFYDDAYKTHIIHSYRLYSVTDFNLDYNGGIQPIISGYDSFFKFFRRALRGNKELEKLDIYPYITVVSGMPVIKTISNTIRINYNHLFNPEFFLAALPKESVNHYFVGLTEISSLNQSGGEELQKIAYLYRINRTKEAEERIRTLLDKKSMDKAVIALNMIGNAKDPIVAEFKIKLLSAIEQHSVAHERILMLEYIETINQESFLYFLEDQFASIVLGRESYLFWAWAIYSQESLAYNSDLTLNEKKLHRLLLRLSVIENLNSASHKEIYERFSTTHSLQISYHAAAIDVFRNIVLKTEIVPDTTVKDLIKYVRELVRLLKLVPNYVENTRSPVVENLKTGNVLFPEFGDSIQEIVAFLNGYLELIKSHFPEKDIVLKRGIIDGLPHLEDKKNHLEDRILLDPTGGTFTIGCQVRREYFKIRVTLMRLMFSFSLKRKVLLFKRKNNSGK